MFIAAVYTVFYVPSLDLKSVRKSVNRQIPVQMHNFIITEIGLTKN